MIAFIFLFGFLFSLKSKADLIFPRQYGSESRLKSWSYSPEGVYYFVGYYDDKNSYPTNIELDDGEKILTIYPSYKCWQIVPEGNKLFIRPMSRTQSGELCGKEDLQGMLTVITDQRNYFFEIRGEYTSSPFNKNMDLMIKFRYPPKKEQSSKNGSGGSGGDSVIQFVSTKVPDLTKAGSYNLNYTVSGDLLITPKKVFDDGKFTYLEFKDILPGIFYVDKNGFEGVVNFRMVGPYLAVEGVYKILTLRHGSDTVCVFNEVLDKIS